MPTRRQNKNAPDYFVWSASVSEELTNLVEEVRFLGDEDSGETAEKDSDLISAALALLVANRNPKKITALPEWLQSQCPQTPVLKEGWFLVRDGEVVTTFETENAANHFMEQFQPPGEIVYHSQGLIDWIGGVDTE